MPLALPKNNKELEKREVLGVFRASRFVRQFAHSNKDISVEAICLIHKEIFKDAWNDIAGKYRIENLKIRGSKHIPPHHTEVPALMKQADDEFCIRLKDVRSAEGFIMKSESEGATDEAYECIDKIIMMAAWIHHKITYIHPFRQGNGRTARLAANLVLQRYGLIGLSIKIEKENKKQYCHNLAQIDNRQDYEPLMDMIFEGIVERYNGVEVKHY